MTDYDPSNPPPEVIARERARDKMLEIDPPTDPVEAEFVREWLDGDFDYSQTQQMNAIIDAIAAKRNQDTIGTN